MSLSGNLSIGAGTQPAGAGIWWILIPLLVAGCVGEGGYKIPLQQNETFSEETAIRVSREALKMAGHDVSKIEPVPYREEGQRSAEKWLARSTLNSDRGYMLWRKNKKDKSVHYSVAMEKIDNYVLCQVGRVK